MVRSYIILFGIISLGFQQANTENPEYQKNYFNNGTLSSEGWVQNKAKVKYWKFYNPYGVLTAEGHYQNGQKHLYWHTYYPNAKLKSEGHYNKGKKTDWWNFYNKQGQLTEKCQYKDNQLHGYRVLLTNEKPHKVERYELGVKTEEWTSYTSFIIDHPTLLGK